MKELQFFINQSPEEVREKISKGRLPKGSLTNVKKTDNERSSLLTISLPDRLVSHSDVSFFIGKIFPENARFVSSK
jgi:hypothetical protein